MKHSDEHQISEAFPMTVAQCLLCGSQIAEIKKLGLGLENLIMNDINYHLQLPAESVENFMTLVELQILVKGCTNTSYEARRFTQKEVTSTQIFFHLKLLLNNL